MKKTISIIVCVMLFFLLCTDLFMFSLSRMATVGFVNKVVDDVNISDTIKTIRESENGVAGELINDIYEKAEERGFSEEEMNTILDSEMTKEIMELYASSVLENGKSLTEEDINKILENNVDEIIENSNGVFSEEDRSKILKAGETMAPTLIENLPDVDKLNEEVGVDAINSDTKSAFKLPWIIMLVVTILLLGCLVVMQWKKYKWLLYTGITILVSSITVILITLLGQGVINLIISENALINNVAGPVVSNMTKTVYIISFVSFVISIVEIVIYNILKKKKIEGKNKKD